MHSLWLAVLMRVVLGAEPSFDVDELKNLELTDLLSIKLSSGSFLDLNILETPATLTVIDRSMIELSGARDLSELLEIFVPGFQVMYRKRTGKVWGMRGVAADHCKHIFLINGVKTNLMSFNNRCPNATLGLFGDIERIEVIHGPGGLVYGTGAIAGVINMITRVPSRQGVEAHAFGGVWGDHGIDMATSLRLDDGQDIRLDVGYRSSPGAGYYRGKVFSDAADTGTWHGESGYIAAGSANAVPTDVRVGATWKYERWSVYTRASRTTQAASAWVAMDVDPYRETGLAPFTVERGWDLEWTTRHIDTTTPRAVFLNDNLLLQVQHDNEWGPDNIKTGLTLLGATQRELTDSQPGYQDQSKNGSIRDTFGEKRVTLTGQYLLKRIESLQSVVGVEATYAFIGNDLDGNNFSGTVQRLSVGNVDYGLLSFYTENHYAFTEELATTAGLRLDKHTRTPWMIAPLVAAVYTPHPDHAIKLSFRSASDHGDADAYEYNRSHFRTTGELRTEPVYSILASRRSLVIPPASLEELRSLRPETTRTFELASTHGVVPGLTLTPAVAYNNVSNLIAWNQDLYRQINLGQYNSLTAELGLRWRWRGLDVVFSYAYQAPVNNSGDPDPLTVPVYAEGVAADGTPIPVLVEGATETRQVDRIREQITDDGLSFLNLTSHLAKASVSYRFDGVAVSTNVRAFGPLSGRRRVNAENDSFGHDYLDVDSKPMFKWNAAVQYTALENLKVSAFVLDILGSPSSLNAARWQLLSSSVVDPTDTTESNDVQLSTTDFRTFMVAVDITLP